MPDESTESTITESVPVETSIRDAVNAVALEERIAEGPNEALFGGTSDSEPKDGVESETKPAAGAIDIDALRAAVEAGDVDAIAKMAGAKVDKLTNDNWIRLRQKEKKLKEQHAAQLRQYEERDAKGREILESAKTEIAPLLEAKQRYLDGDIVGAMQLVFGDDIDGVLEKGVKQKHGRDPELVKLEREHREMRAKVEAKERAEQERQDSAAREQHAAHALTQITQALSESTDDFHIAASQDPIFMRIVTQHMLRAAQDGNPNLTLTDAVSEVSERIFSEYSGASKSPLIKFLVSRRDQPVDENAPQPGKVAARKAPASREVSHVRASKAATDAPVPDNAQDFGQFLRAAVNRAERG